MRPRSPLMSIPSGEMPLMEPHVCFGHGAGFFVSTIKILPMNQPMSARPSGKMVIQVGLLIPLSIWRHLTI
jgi:hypothetical protein